MGRGTAERGGGAIGRDAPPPASPVPLPIRFADREDIPLLHHHVAKPGAPLERLPVRLPPLVFDRQPLGREVLDR